MQYFARFVPSMQNGTPPGDWERFRNAEQPAWQLKDRAKTGKGMFYVTTEKRRVYPLVTVDMAFPDADMSAMFLVWVNRREQPAEDEAPNEVWHLTSLGGLIRTPWSAVIEPVEYEPEDDEMIREPSISNHEPDEISVIDWDEVDTREIWRPPTLEELADRKVILVGDKRPLAAGAFVERNRENFAPTGLRQPCEECGVVPNAVTLKCRC